MFTHDSLIFPDSSFIALMVCCTTFWPSLARPLASLDCCEVRAAFWAISWAAAPSSLIAAATLSVRLACWSELPIEALETLTTRVATSPNCAAVEATSRIEV